MTCVNLNTPDSLGWIGAFLTVDTLVVQQLMLHRSSDTPHTAPKWLKQMERETGVEPATFSLGSRKSGPPIARKTKKTGSS